MLYASSFGKLMEYYQDLLFAAGVCYLALALDHSIILFFEFSFLIDIFF